MNFREIFSSDYWTEFWRNTSSSIISAASQILLIVILFLIVRIALYKVIDRILVPVIAREGPNAEPGRAARIKTLQGLVKSVAAYVIGFIAGVMILRALGVDPIPALTTASVAALAVGFGAQMLVRDVITGFFILLENQYAVGEYVTIAGVTGTVEEIGMRTTRIRDDVGKLTILANGTVSQVTNHSRGPLLSTIDISIPPGADIEKVTVMLNRIGETASMDRNGDVVAPFRCDGIIAMDAGKVTLRISGRVSTGKQDEVLMDLRSRIRQKLIEDGIGII